jgi:ABC-type glycerol-3-phosphate transport system permease component
MAMLMQRMRVAGSKAALYGLLTLLAAFMIMPFVWMLSTSFKPQEEIFARPPILISRNMNLDGYRYIIEYDEMGGGGVLRALWNTFFIAFSFTTLSVFLCALGGYGFAKYRFPGQNVLFAFLLGTMVIPPAITMVPTYILVLKLGWIDTYWPLIVPGAANAFGIFYMRQYISTISDELMDAARIDGCGDFATFWRVIFPICGPGLTTLGLLLFMGSWNAYLYPSIYLKSPAKWTLPLMQTLMTGPPGFTFYRELTGVAVISVIPLLILFLAFQRQFTEGITAGALQGV